MRKRYLAQSNEARSLKSSVCQQSFEHLFWNFNNYNIQNDAPLDSIGEEYSKLKGSFDCALSDTKFKKEPTRIAYANPAVSD